MKAIFSSVDLRALALLASALRWLAALDPRGDANATEMSVRSGSGRDEPSHEEALGCDRGGL